MNERTAIKEEMDRVANQAELSFEDRTVRLCQLAYHYVNTFRLPKEEETA